ncbi:hypothetical protein [Cupriavidus sp. IDO]|uniref:hypothetical protein n=1 Tax=Cupriavidus sp. IDO TaxID=1539142 RepID=UPI0005796D05|nr:hypothetical protein [Cupriavidus sp. IDO]KWR89714.1 hypothetical protein RM96_12335 [Cupriavidus sp. IDO]
MQNAQMKKGCAHRKDATPTATANCSQTAPTFLLHLQELAARHSLLGLSAGTAALSLVELWGIYCSLNGIEGSGL